MRQHGDAGSWEMVMKIDGQCHCGFIAYEAEIDPEKVEVCHCTDCQILSGSAFRIVAPVEGDSLRILSGEFTTYIKTADSGNKRAQMFCPKCATPIYSAFADGGPPRYVRVSTARQRNELPPRTQIWTRRAQPWLADLCALPEA
jgi:hypothetical protein